MSDLRNISGIGKASQVLLEAAGIPDIAHLARAETDALTAELKRANKASGTAKRPPPKVEVARWIRAARAKAGSGSGGGADNPLASFSGELFAIVESSPPKAEAVAATLPDERSFSTPAFDPGVSTQLPLELQGIPEADAGAAPAADPGEPVVLLVEPPAIPEADGFVAPAADPGEPAVLPVEPLTLPAEYFFQNPSPTSAATAAVVAEPPIIPEEAVSPDPAIGSEEAVGVAAEPPADPEDDDFPDSSAVSAETAEGVIVNHEATEQVRELLESAPVAIPLPARQLIEAKVGVTEIPQAYLLNRYPGDLEIRVTNRRGPRRIPRAPNLTKSRVPSGAYVQIADPSPPRVQFDVSRMRSFAEIGARPTILPVTRAAPAVVSGGERLDLLRTPLEKTNRGRDPRSRWFVRGLLHTHPWEMRIGALITLVVMSLMVPSILAALLLLLSDVSPTLFHWVSPWLLVLPCLLIVAGPFYLFFGTKCRCRVCNQRQFFPRACLKNSKAHRIIGLGYIIPVALHMLLFQWFRCTYCGTPVRLRK